MRKRTTTVPSSSSRFDAAGYSGFSQDRAASITGAVRTLARAGAGVGAGGGAATGFAVVTEVIALLPGVANCPRCPLALPPPKLCPRCPPVPPSPRPHHAVMESVRPPKRSAATRVVSASWPSRSPTSRASAAAKIPTESAPMPAVCAPPADKPRLDPALTHRTGKPHTPRYVRRADPE